MIYGIILAGGKSTRMGTNKILFEYEGKPLILYAIETMKRYVDRIVVVTGRYNEEIREALKGVDVEIAFNPDYEKGMFSSVLTGIKRVEGDFFILPGDCPFVNGCTYDALLSGCGDIRVPSYEGNEGHPIFISYKYKNELLSYPLDSNLKVFRDDKKYEIINVEDQNIVINLNTILDVINFKTERKR